MKIDMKEKFPTYFALFAGIYFMIFFFSLTILIGPGLSSGLYKYTEFWIFSIFPVLPLFTLFAYIHNRDPTTETRWRLINTALISLAGLDFAIFIFPLALA